MQHGAWNKVAFIKKLLDTTAVADAEWILYMEADTLFDAPGFTLPFEFYAGRDIILLGNPATLRAGDPKGGLLACALSLSLYWLALALATMLQQVGHEPSRLCHRDARFAESHVAFICKTGRCIKPGTLPICFAEQCANGWLLHANHAFQRAAAAMSCRSGPASQQSEGLCSGAGVDFGVLLVRNSERSKQLFAELVNKSEHFQV